MTTRSGDVDQGQRLVVVVGEQWEMPFVAATVSDQGRRQPGTRFAVPPEFAQVRADVDLEVLGDPPERFRSVEEISADVLEVLERRGSRDHVLVHAGVIGPGATPVHRPRAARNHQVRQHGQVRVWTADTSTHYFQALVGLERQEQPPVHPAYGPGAPIFVHNTNDFDELAPGPHDDYVILASGLLGLKMIAESNPAARARALVYDINPAQLAWSRHVLERAGEEPTLDGLVESFVRRHPGVEIRVSMAHESDNVERQRTWYAEHRSGLAQLSSRLHFDLLTADLLNRPHEVLSWLSPERSVFFMYLDLFVQWNPHHTPPWIVTHPELAQSLELEVASRSAAARFLPGPGSQVLQLRGSPLVEDSDGGSLCT